MLQLITPDPLLRELVPTASCPTADDFLCCCLSVNVLMNRQMFCLFLNVSHPLPVQNPSSVIDRNQRLFIWQAGLFTVVHFPEEDITVLWDHKTTVHVQVGPHWQVNVSRLSS